ncbi:TerF-like vWA domain-containing protein [Streptomyces sp. TLI_235]|nr:VWA domain-containing protein [Streptomyces sp. TLI_235]PBC76811.1 TerF-like vWA domain-containing protein [Streptomyces sp. TLI_235]
MWMFFRRRRRGTAAPTAGPAAAQPPQAPARPTAPARAGAGPAISLDKLQAAAPALVSLYKTAGVSLRKQGLDGRRAAVYLVLDHSASMSGLYRDGSVQRLAEQSLALSANLDDDGTVPVVLFNDRAYEPQEVRIGRHDGAVQQVRAAVDAKFGGTRYAPAMKAVLKHYKECGATDPAFVIFQTDGAAFDRKDVQALLRSSSQLPVFWQFLGFGEHDAKHFTFLRSLTGLDGRATPNAGFCATGKHPRSLADDALYGRLLAAYPGWLDAAKAAGVTG